MRHVAVRVELELFPPPSRSKGALVAGSRVWPPQVPSGFVANVMEGSTFILNWLMSATSTFCTTTASSDVVVTSVNVSVTSSESGVELVVRTEGTDWRWGWEERGRGLYAFVRGPIG